MKKQQSTIKLYAKPDIEKSFRELEFAWLTTHELQEYQKKGFKRVKEPKGGRDYATIS